MDTLGGVDMCIPSYNVNTPGWVEGSRRDREHRADPLQTRSDTSWTRYTGLDVVPGCQHLDGIQALAYVRARHPSRASPIPDFARIGRQQQFMRAVINQMLQPNEIAKAPGLVGPVLVEPAPRSGLPAR